MKTTKMVVAALIALGVGPAMADEYRVYRATKPYWWTTSAMKCDVPNNKGDYWCGAGAWQIQSLTSFGEDAIAAWGYAGYNPGTKKLSVSIESNFGDRKVTFTCAGQTEPLPVQRERRSSQEPVAIFEYWVWAPRARIDECLLKPIKMTVDGRTYRLDTKLLREAVENAIARAEG